MKNKSGFTIVELLIVIVVIAILATISIVAYNGIQQRANNTSIIDAASKTLKVIQAYVAEKGMYPYTTNADVCVTNVSGCSSGSTNATFETNIATIGSLPRSVPESSGITLTYAATSWNGESQPLRLTYYLYGDNQQCGLSRISKYEYPAYVTSLTGYTYSNGSGKTRCWVSVSGPSA